MRGSKKSFVAVIVMAFLILTVFSAEASEKKKIGILLATASDRHINSYKGVMDQLKKDGFGKSKAKYTVENAKGSKAKAIEVMRDFAASNMDLIIAIGTGAATAAAIEIKDIAVVFSTVYDPIEAGIAKNWKSSGNNTTGTSTLVPLPDTVSALKEFIPIKRLAILYTPGEKNTEAVFKELPQIQKKLHIKIDPVILTANEEVPNILPEVLRTADAVYLTGSNTVIETVPLIVDMATKAKVATITHRDDFSEKGVLLSVSADAYHTGRLAGGKAVKVLKGEKPSSIPIETVKKFDLILNMKTAKAGQFKIPPEFMKKVTKIIE